MRYLILIYILICEISSMFSQADEINHRKYWYYRSRLTNDFMKIGPNQGESLPFSQRNKYGDFYKDTKSPYMQAGTDVVSQLGPYICVLVTEYKLLKDNGQPTDSTLREIYYALEAFNRLDYNAEDIYGYPKNLNGFFIRTDIYKSFIVNNKSHFNYDEIINPLSINTAGGFCSESHIEDLVYYEKDSLGQPKYSSEEPYCRWEDDKNDPIKRGKLAMSLDQCVNMFSAFALINKYFVSGEKYIVNGNAQPFLDGETQIRDEARHIANRIISALQGGGDWRILLPGGNHVDEIEANDDRGGNVWPLSFAFSEANCKIQNGNTTNQSNQICVNGFTGNNAANFLQTSLGWQAWKLETATNAAAAIVAVNPDNLPKFAGLEAACNCIYSCSLTQVLIGYIQNVVSYLIGWIQHFVYGTPIPQYTFTNILNNETINKIQYFTQYDLEWASLLRNELHGGGNLDDNVFSYSIFLHEAPCDGPRYYPNDQKNPFNSRWRTVDNIDHPDGSDSNPAEFNGLDYMLYHNLYYLHNGYGNNLSPVDLRYREVTTTFPNVSNVGIGSNASPLYLPSFEFINARNIINAVSSTNSSDPNNGNVTYRAGKLVHLEPGFNANAGSYFHGYIQKFGCVTGNDVGRLASNDSIKNNNYSSIEWYTEPTAYINYPPNVEEYEETTVQNANQSSAKKNSFGNNVNNDINKINLYPNPNNGLFNIEFILSDNESASVNIIDVLNTEVYSQKMNTSGKNKLEVDIKNFGKGVYIVKFNSNKGINTINKVIVQ
jgi:hypothetical protein